MMPEDEEDYVDVLRGLDVVIQDIDTILIDNGVDPETGNGLNEIE